MENIEFRAHLASVISLLRTLVIKCDVIGEVDNQLLINAGYPVTDDKRSWRYYLNMNGEYHPTDDPMYVTSLDNRETILFSKANLDEHLATLRGYQPGSYWYRRLTEEYPHQIELINGILSPIDMDFAIGSQDYKILRYDRTLVDRNEEQLLGEIQDWITVFCNNTLKNNDYIYTDNLMLPTMLSLMYGMLIPLVLIVRLEAYGTRYVNEHHIWSRLNSHGNFEPYRKLLTHEQKMWLYRNIEWVKSHTGQQFTLDQLIDNLLTPTMVPLSHYNALIDTKNMVTEGLGEGRYKRRPLNLIEDTAEDNRTLSVREMMNKEIPLARDNAKERDYIEESVDESLKYSIHSTMSTKVVESAMEDYSNRHADTLMKTLFHEWIYMVKHNKYDAIMDLTNPLTGESFRLNMRDAIICWQYLTTRAREEDTTYIRPFFYQSVMRMKVPPLQTFMDAGGVEYLPKYLCEDIRRLWIPSPRIISSESFFDHSFEVYSILWKGKKVYSKFMDIYRHARTKEAVSRLFERGIVYLNEEGTDKFDKWFKDKELNFDIFTREDCLTLAWDIFQKGTAWNTKASASLRQVQGNLIQLMKELASYTIQYVTNMDDGNFTIEGNERPNFSPSPGTGMENTGDVSGALLLPIDMKLWSRHKSVTTIKTNDTFHENQKVYGFMEGKGLLPMEMDMKPVVIPKESVQPIARLDLNMTLTERKYTL